MSADVNVEPRRGASRERRLSFVSMLAATSSDTVEQERKLPAELEELDRQLRRKSQLPRRAQIASRRKLQSRRQ